MCFCFTIATLLRENGDSPKRVVDFLAWGKHIPKTKHGKRRGFRRKKLQQQRQTVEIVEDFACEDKNSEIFGDSAVVFLHYSTNFFIFVHFILIIPHVSSCFFMFLHVFFFFFVLLLRFISCFSSFQCYSPLLLVSLFPLFFHSYSDFSFSSFFFIFHHFFIFSFLSFLNISPFSSIFFSFSFTFFHFFHFMFSLFFILSFFDFFLVCSFSYFSFFFFLLLFVFPICSFLLFFHFPFFHFFFFQQMPKLENLRTVIIIKMTIFHCENWTFLFFL